MYGGASHHREPRHAEVNSRAEARGWLEPERILSIRVTFMLALCIGGVWLLDAVPQLQGPLLPLATVTAAIAEWLMGLASLVTVRDGSILTHTNGFGLHVVYDCTGLVEIGFIVAVIGVYPGMRKHKLMLIVFGAGLAIAINQLRLVTLWVVGVDYPDWFDLAHLGLWHGTMILWTSIYILLGMRLLDRLGTTSAN